MLIYIGQILSEFEQNALGFYVCAKTMKTCPQPLVVAVKVLWL